MARHGRCVVALTFAVLQNYSCALSCRVLQDLKDHMRGAGGQVEYVKIMQDFDGRPKVLDSFRQGCQAASAFAHTTKYTPLSAGFWSL